MDFAQRLHERVERLGTRVCLGIDPRPEAHPLTHPDRFDGDPAKTARAVVVYFQAILEATAERVACYKLQSAFFERLGVPGVIALAQILADVRARGVPVVLDAKRGDMASTAEAYADAYLGDGVFAADALTVNPYLGTDSLEPFANAARRGERGLFVVLKTSNPGSRDFQDLRTEDGRRVYEHVAERLVALNGPERDGYGPVGAVVGATFPEELAALRRRLPTSVLLVPGYGAQGGTARDVAGAFDARGLGAIVSSSRALTYLGDGDDFPLRAARATEAMRDAIEAALADRLRREEQERGPAA